MVKKITALVLCLALFCLFGCAPEKAETPEINSDATRPYDIRIKFSDGLTAEEYAKILEENNVCSAADFLAAVNAPESDYWFINEIPNPQSRPFLLEGYLYPGTYDFRYNSDAQTVLNCFLDNFDKQITDTYKSRAKELGYSIDDALTIASIIREEAIDSELKNVSSVIHNRLDSDYGKLECDVTIFYLNNHVKPYTDDISRYKSLYNTYDVKGLPAGPITNVSTSAIEAALYPADTDYYFFVYDDARNYYYAETWKEHSANVNKYYKK
ncbi:MAG: endolytic transglycosylase MltG [Clostridia bacterium]|nr:endolytic transglycosylase MltG [Clostridia bacterium]